MAAEDGTAARAPSSARRTAGSRPSTPKKPADPEPTARGAERELDVVLADWAERQREIVARSQSESAQWVVLITASLAIGAGFLGLRTTAPPVLPTLFALGALLLISQLANLSVIAVTTELRRLYIQQRIAPRVRELVTELRAGVAPSPGLMSFEKYDRDEHWSAYNHLLFGRLILSLIPPIALVGGWAFSVATIRQPEWLFSVQVIALLIAGTIVVFSGRALSIMWSRTKAVLVAEAEADPDLTTASPDQLRAKQSGRRLRRF